MGLRQNKVEAALKKEIGIIVHDKLKDKKLGFVTIVRVEVTPDLRYARVYFSVIGKEKEQKATQAVLKKAVPFIRRLLAKRMNLRLIPEIAFKFDDSAEYSIKIQKMIDDLKEKDELKESC